MGYIAILFLFNCKSRDYILTTGTCPSYPFFLMPQLNICMLFFLIFKASSAPSRVEPVVIVSSTSNIFSGISAFCFKTRLCIICFLSCIPFPGILLKTHKTSHLQYTHPFYQSCLTVIDNGLMYPVEY